MICRKGVVDNGNYNIVWFGSYGLNQDGTAKKANNFNENLAGLVDYLTQKLSVIKHELWWDYEYGLPLADKINKKTIMDLAVLDILNESNEVTKIANFESHLNGRAYNMSCTIISVYGTTEIIFE